MQQLYPEDEESPEAREGTAAHLAVTEPLQGRTVSVGMVAPNGHPIDQDMIDAGKDFIADVLATKASASPGSALRVEERVNMRETVHALNWGTPDAYLIDGPNRRVHVWDYKYGHGYVDAFGNWQCVDYLAGILEDNEVPMDEWPIWDFTVTIGQPRNYHPDGQLRYWHFNGDVLVAKVRELAAAAILATAPDAPMVTGSQCKNCTARHACPALERVAMGLVDMSMTTQPVDLPPAALGLELRIIRDAIKRLEARATGLEEQGLALARSGKDVPHWKPDYSWGRERWTMEAPMVIALGSNFGVALAKPVDAITPAQARAALKAAGKDPDILKDFAEKPRGSMKLLPFDQSDFDRSFR